MLAAVKVKNSTPCKHLFHCRHQEFTLKCIFLSPRGCVKLTPAARGFTQPIREDLHCFSTLEMCRKWRRGSETFEIHSNSMIARNFTWAGGLTDERSLPPHPSRAYPSFWADGRGKGMENREGELFLHEPPNESARPVVAP